MIPNPVDPFDEWLRLPVDAESSDPRFDVRRATPDDYEQIYDVVDSAFEKKRPRAMYDWMYRHNPSGRARCWILIEKSSGNILKTGAGFPWPIWRGTQPLMGSIGGDAATVRHWQRKGLAKIRRPFSKAHPWNERFCGIAGPNEQSRAVSKSIDETDGLLGFLRGGVIPIRADALLRRVGAAQPIARPLGAIAAAAMSGWHSVAAPSPRGAPGEVERVSRFTTDFDDVTERCMSWPMFWSPHNADFLNWRYLDHPVESYVALALVENERPTAYAVVCIEEEKATLTEFAVETGETARAAKLFFSALDVARDAGCASLIFYGPPGWRHWRLFSRFGFIPYRTNNHFEAWGKEHEPDVLDIRNWQVTPGDRDFR